MGIARLLLRLGQDRQVAQSHDFLNGVSDFGRLGTILGLPSRVCLLVRMSWALPMMSCSCNPDMAAHPPSLKATPLQGCSPIFAPLSSRKPAISCKSALPYHTSVLTLPSVPCSPIMFRKQQQQPMRGLWHRNDSSSRSFPTIPLEAPSTSGIPSPTQRPIATTFLRTTSRRRIRQSSPLPTSRRVHPGHSTCPWTLPTPTTPPTLRTVTMRPASLTAIPAPRRPRP
ncbi:hypothetical protein B0H21DRAFT_379894 [Amylocystis lapponica]|nr:hypothetical protein B0H21DRAFT_379894 [Amylocystis lapponica]